MVKSAQIRPVPGQGAGAETLCPTDTGDVGGLGSEAPQWLLGVWSSRRLDGPGVFLLLVRVLLFIYF